MSKLINLDDSRNCYIGMDGEYEQWNIDPNVLAEAQPEVRTEMSSADTISRQAAIEITKMFTESIDAKLIKKRLLALPTAQPEIIRCKDCDDWDRDNVINNVAACAEWSDPENGMTRYTKECDYCSRAERRTDDIQ